MLSVLNVDKNVKFHSNLTQADPSTAANVTLNEDPREEIDIKLISQNLFSTRDLFLSQYFFSIFRVHMHTDAKREPPKQTSKQLNHIRRLIILHC